MRSYQRLHYMPACARSPIFARNTRRKYLWKKTEAIAVVKYRLDYLIVSPVIQREIGRSRILIPKDTAQRYRFSFQNS